MIVVAACGAPESRPAAAVVFQGQPDIRVPVQVPRTPEEIRRGLMHRRHLPADHGMLFLFSRQEVQSFWMKDTLIALDIIFVTGEMTVAGVVENAEPGTLTPRTVGKPSRYVVEVNAGFARAHGIREGTRVRFENID
jgi:hypothetical protein